MSIMIKYFKKNQDVCNVYFNLLVIRSYNTVFTVRVKLCNLRKEGGEKDTGYSSTRVSLTTKTGNTLITYPSLGHSFYLSSQWSTGIGPLEQYVLADLYAWLEPHYGLSHSYATATSTTGTNTSSLNTNTTSPLSSSSKR
ncbi:MAG: hypothetical protein WCF23_08705 [Candidatus Nitrosopolaris sp.]